jgi:hypothetical protein
MKASQIMIRLVFISWFAALSANAQSELSPDLTGLRYPPLANAARIEGSVEFLRGSGDFKPVSGHPMLIASARSNLERWKNSLSKDIPVSVTYRYHLLEPRIVEEKVPIGNSVERFFLRILLRPTNRKVSGCAQPVDPAPRFQITRDAGRDIIEIIVEAEKRCVQTNTSVVT